MMQVTKPSAADPFSSAAVTASNKEAKKAIRTTVLDTQEAEQLRIYGPHIAALYAGRATNI